MRRAKEMSSLKILNNHIVEKKFREWEAAQKDKDPELAVALVKWAVRIVNQCPDLLEIDEDGNIVNDEPKNEEKKAEAPAAAAPKAEPEKNEAQPVKRRGRKPGRKKKADSYVERVMSEVEDAEDPQDVDTGVFLDTDPSEGDEYGLDA